MAEALNVGCGLQRRVEWWLFVGHHAAGAVEGIGRRPEASTRRALVDGVVAGVEADAVLVGVCLAQRVLDALAATCKPGV